MNQLFPLTLAALCLTAPAAAQITSFQHIILVIQENRTPDDMFQGLCTTPSACSTQPGPQQYDIQTTGGWIKPRPPARPFQRPSRWASATIFRTHTQPSFICAI